MLQFYYCATAHPWWVAALYAAWLAALFVALATAADDFFCPNLAVIAKTLRCARNSRHEYIYPPSEPARYIEKERER